MPGPKPIARAPPAQPPTQPAYPPAQWCFSDGMLKTMLAKGLDPAECVGSIAQHFGIEAKLNGDVGNLVSFSH